MQRRGIFGAPDFVAEILSPSTKSVDLKLKKELYEMHGVEEYWIVYPEEKKVECYLLRGGKYEYRGTFLRDDEIEVRSIPGLKVNL